MLLGDVRDRPVGAGWRVKLSSHPNYCTTAGRLMRSKPPSLPVHASIGTYQWLLSIPEY